jgi:hypothetical protein
MAVKNFIQKCADSLEDAPVHQRFVRFSLGEFKREKVLLKRTKAHLQIQAGFEFATDVYFLIAELLEDKDVKIHAKGLIVSKDKELTGDIELAGFSVIAQKGKKYTVECELSPQDFAKGIEKIQKYFILLNCKVDDIALKMKPSMPKPGSLKEKFLTLKVGKEFIEKVQDNFLFDLEFSTYKKIEIEHTFLVDEIAIPKEHENDFAAARKYAQKIGRIKRVITVDGTMLKDYEINFKA